MSKYFGNRKLGSTVQVPFNTIDAASAPITLAGTPTVNLYQDCGATPLTVDGAGVTLAVDVGQTGHHVVTVVFATAGVLQDHDYEIRLTAGTVDSVSVVGQSIGVFGVENAFADANLVQILRDAFTLEDSVPATITQASLTALVAAVLDRVLAGNHEVAGSTGKVLQSISTNVAGLGGVSIPTAAENAAAVLDEAIGEHTGLLAGVSTLTSQNVKDAVDASGTATAVTAINDLTKAGGDGDLAEVASNTAEALATVGTTGVKIEAAEKASIAAGVWSALTDSLTTVGSVGKWLLDNMLNAAARTGAFPAAALANAPTGATASYMVSSATVGAAPECDIIQYRYAAFGPVAITAATAQTGDSHVFLVYSPGKPSTVLWSLTTAGGEISVGADTVTLTLTDTDAHMGTPGKFRYILRNTTDDTAVCVGYLTIVDCPNAPST